MCPPNNVLLKQPSLNRVKDQSKLPKSLLVGGQCLDRVMFCLRSFDFNEFSLTFTRYLMLLTAIFVKNSEIEPPQKSQTFHLKHQSATRFA